MARIKAYQHEKSALQDALTARIVTHTPGADTRQAIDAFNQENAGRIASLTREREAIRDELARLAAATTDAATGKSLNTLLKEFADGVQEMETSPRPYST
jgi:capsule polysaccharide export protein KpsE/RkpR